MTADPKEVPTMVLEKLEAPGSARPTPSLPVDPRLPEPGPSAPGSTRLADLGSALALGVVGAAALLLVWQVVASAKPNLPSPAETLAEFKLQLADPFHDNGSNDKGIFIMLSDSIVKVFSGFGLAALIGIPAGFALGISSKLTRIVSPIVEFLRPVSPLAWYPLALTFFLTDTPSRNISFYASILTIGVTALWPTLINTAAGVASIPQDHRNVARVFRFSRAKYARKVLLPHSLGAILTGLRLSMGISWMVIVAVEMLSGGSGIGFFVWDSYNNSKLPAVVVAIFFIGLVGLGLNFCFKKLSERFDYTAVSR